MADIEPLATRKPEAFACPHCGTRYTLVRAEADAASASGQLVCRSCGRPKTSARAARGQAVSRSAQWPRGPVRPQVFPRRSILLANSHLTYVKDPPCALSQIAIARLMAGR